MNHHLKQNGRVLTIIFVCLDLSVITVPVFAAIPVKSATASVLASAAPIKVSGLVVDENGEPLPGVSTLMGPTIKSIACANNKITLNLASHYENVVGYAFNYPSIDGGTTTKRTDISSLKIELESAAPNGKVEYAAIYMPTEDSIDEYLTSFAQIDY